MDYMLQFKPKKELPALVTKFAIPSGIVEPLDEELAKSTGYLTSHQLNEKNMQDTAGKYASLDNCQTLDVPKVNATIWDNLNGKTRSKDLKLQRVQRLLTRGITAFARSVDGTQLSELQQYTLALLCNTHFELNCIRKDAIRPEVKPKYAHLCKASNMQSAKHLFGEDLSKQVKDLQEGLKAAVGLVKTPFVS